tara:strand:- start:183 stop:431 length:249 start_codon:yes stop_codon:yes gene_type:complete
MGRLVLQKQEEADEIDMDLKEIQRLRLDAKSLTLWELLESNPRLNRHIVSNVWHTVQLEDKLDNTDKDRIEKLSLGGHEGTD